MEGNFVPRPWAYFSFSPEPEQNGALAMSFARSEHDVVCDRFVSNLPGVIAEVS